MDDDWLKSYVNRYMYRNMFGVLSPRNFFTNSVAGTATQEQTSLSIDDFNKAVELLQNIPPATNPVQMTESTFAIIEAGKMPKYYDRSLKERLFSRLDGKWKPLRKYRLVLHPQYKPCAYVVNDEKGNPSMVIYHPALKKKIMDMFTN